MHATPGLVPTLLGGLPVPPAATRPRTRRSRIPWAVIGGAKHVDLRIPRFEPRS